MPRYNRDVINASGRILGLSNAIHEQTVTIIGKKSRRWLRAQTAAAYLAQNYSPEGAEKVKVAGLRSALTSMWEEYDRIRAQEALANLTMPISPRGMAGDPDPNAQTCGECGQEMPDDFGIGPEHLPTCSLHLDLDYDSPNGYRDTLSGRCLCAPCANAATGIRSPRRMTPLSLEWLNAELRVSGHQATCTVCGDTLPKTI